MSLSADEASALAALSDSLESTRIRLEEDPHFTLQAKSQVRSHPLLAALAGRIQKSMTEAGYCVISFAALAEYVDLLADQTVITALLSAIGTPILIFEDWPIWKPIVTKPEIEPWRAGGVGYIPLHMDFVNCEFPPEYVGLFCLIEDSEGGGNSIVASMTEAVQRLSDHDKEVLSQRTFVDGKVVNLRHVGCDVNPFAILSSDGKWPVRFTAKMIPRIEDPIQKRAAEALDKNLRQCETTFPLCRFELLLVDQRQVVHGRAPLAGDQANIPAPNRRLLRQLFLRADQ